jgi:DNA repair exonuclease SbcCD ATPase subunit
MSILAKNKMIFIDEGVSVLDKEHIDNFDNIAQFLTSNFNQVVIISHIETLKEFITKYIYINKIDDNSHVFYD